MVSKWLRVKLYLIKRKPYYRLAKQHAVAAWSQWASRVASGTSTTWRAVVSPQGLLASGQWEPAPVEAPRSPATSLHVHLLYFPAILASFAIVFQLWHSLTADIAGHMSVSRFLFNIRPCASNRDEFAGSNHEIDGFNVSGESPFFIPIFNPEL